MLLREPARPPFIREHRHAPWFAVGTVCFGAFMGQLDASVVTVAFPALQRQFGAHLAAVQWVSLAYLLALTALLVPAGRWSDQAGRKLVYLYGFILFAGASAACGLAPSLSLLIGLRVVQAAGAAMLQANSVALVVTSVAEVRRRAALGIQAAAQAVGLASGPVVGGLLVATAGWRWVFFLNVPVGLIAIVAGVYLLPRTRGLPQPGRRGSPGARRGMPGSPGEGGVRGVSPLRGVEGAAKPPWGAQPDLAGMALLGVATTAAMLAISGVSGLRWPAWVVAACAAGALTAGLGLYRHERRIPVPLLDFPALAASGAVRSLGGALCSYLVLFGPLVLIPQVVTARGGSPLTAGLLLTALPAGFGLAATVADRAGAARWANRTRCGAGGALAAGCAAGLAAPVPQAATMALLGLLGVGLGLYTPANNAAIMAILPARDAATAGGMVNMTRGIGTALGVAVVTLGLYAARLAGHPAAGPGLTMALLAGAGILAAVAGAGARPPAASGQR